MKIKLFAKIKKIFSVFGKKNTQVKRCKVTKRDIEENILRIKTAMDATPVGTPQWKVLSDELEHEVGILKKFKDAKQVISAKDALVVGVTGLALVFFVALEREVPSAMKTAATILKWVPFKG